MLKTFKQCILILYKSIVLELNRILLTDLTLLFSYFTHIYRYSPLW